MEGMKRIFCLVHTQAREGARQAILEAPDGFVVEIKPPTRSLEQSAKFHAMCGDLAKSGIKWAGKSRTLEEWKVLLISGHAVATGKPAEVIAGLEGEFLNIRESTATMSKARQSSLIEYAQAFIISKGLALTE